MTIPRCSSFRAKRVGQNNRARGCVLCSYRMQWPRKINEARSVRPRYREGGNLTIYSLHLKKQVTAPSAYPFPNYRLQILSVNQQQLQQLDPPEYRYRCCSTNTHFIRKHYGAEFDPGPRVALTIPPHCPCTASGWRHLCPRRAASSLEHARTAVQLQHTSRRMRVYVFARLSFSHDTRRTFAVQQL